MSDMISTRRKLMHAGAALALAAIVSAPLASTASAQQYPTKPIKVVVPFPPGGALDVLTRIIAQKMSEDLKQQLVIENRPGATGHVGSEAVAKSTPDGYTLLFTASSTQVVSPLLMKLSYNPMEDLTPVGLAALVDNIIVVHPSLPVKSIPELVQYAKANPDKIAYASTGVGSNLHLAGEMLNVMAGIKMRHIPYSTPQMMPDLLSGRVQMLVGNIPQVAQYFADGKLRPLAATSLERLPEYPNLPTVNESLPGYQVIAWGMLMAPKATPKAIVDTLNGALGRALATAEVRAAFAKQNFKTAFLSPEKSLEFMRDQSGKWAKVIKEANIPPVQ